MRLPALCSRALVVVGATVFALALLPVAQAKPDTSGAGSRVAIGDSVMLGAKWNLLNRQDFTMVDAVVSRQAAIGPVLLGDLGEGLATNVIVHLGTNGSYPLRTCKKLVKTAGPTRKVFLMTLKVPRLWEPVNNEMLRTCDGAFPADQVHLIDWNWAASRHEELWLYNDGVHLRPAGARAFARIINEAIAKAYPPVTTFPPAPVQLVTSPAFAARMVNMGVIQAS